MISVELQTLRENNYATIVGEYNVMTHVTSRPNPVRALAIDSHVTVRISMRAQQNRKRYRTRRKMKSSAKRGGKIENAIEQEEK